MDSSRSKAGVVGNESSLFKQATQPSACQTKTIESRLKASGMTLSAIRRGDRSGHRIYTSLYEDLLQ